MARDSDRRVVYEVVLQEASTAQVGQYVNGVFLAEVWSQLWLPRRVRQLWEERFTELTRAA